MPKKVYDDPFSQFMARVLDAVESEIINTLDGWVAQQSESESESVSTPPRRPQAKKVPKTTNKNPQATAAYHLKVLGMTGPRHPTLQELKARHRELAKKYHPDLPANRTAAKTERWTKIQSSYNWLAKGRS
jgi:hypothetical protein